MALRDLLKRRRPLSPRSEWLAAEHESIDAWLAALPDHVSTNHDLSENELGARFLAMSRDGQARLVCAAVERMASASGELGRGGSLMHTVDGIAYRRGNYGLPVEISLLSALARALTRRKLPFDAEKATVLAEALEPAARAGGWFSWVPLAQCVTAIERAIDADGMTSELRRALGRLEGALLSSPESYADERKAAQRLRVLLGVEPETPTLDRSEPWADAALKHVRTLPESEREAWEALLDHAGAAKQARPSKRWRAQAAERLDAVGTASFAACVDKWFSRVREVGQRQLVEPNATVLRGLVWMCAEAGDPTLAVPLGRLAEACMVRIPNLGARSTKVANAATNALAELPAATGAAQLTRLRGKAKVPSLRGQVEGALGEAARSAGLSVDELEESAVPDLGFDGDGRHVRAVGDYKAVLDVTTADRVDIGWISPDGKRRKTVPKAVRESAPEAVAQVRATAKEARGLVAGQRDRLERLLTAERTWRFADWRARYLDHPLVGTLARRLVWRLGPTLGAWWDGGLMDVRGAPIEVADDETVALWHPIESDVETVQGWRAWFEERLVTQPFKQAHREIYLLTDAERETRTYSNRFAGHVVRQHQLAALCRQRGWHYELRGWFDSWNEPTLYLPRFDLRAELLLVGGEAEGEANLSGSGVYVHMGTDQVRFSSPGGTIVDLESVPPVAFSEVMRDVDLFVSVTSIGNDPTWMDRGAEVPYADYWHDFAFGELSELARTRRETLVRLVPKLAIADRCEVSDRHLVVRGERATYRIHIGSANVMMEPGSRYLCIVPSQLGGSRRRRVHTPFVPFEGDGTLSLILSKAFLLARDSEIEDKVILAQMR